MNKKNKTLISAAVLAALVGYLIFTGMSNTISQYVEISEIKAGTFDGQLASVNGTVVNDTLEWNPETMELTFTMTDHTGVLDVYYKGNLPNSLAGGIPVVVQGQYSEEVFMARNILVKCPSKYEASYEEDSS